MELIHIKRKILKKAFPFILTAAAILIIGFILRLSSDSGVIRVVSYLLVLTAIATLTIIGNPLKKFRKQLEELGYTEKILKSDLEKGVSYKNTDVGTQFLVNYGVFTKVISFQDVLWTYMDTALLLHFILKDNTEYTVQVENKESGLYIVKQMEKGCPWILFGYHEEVAQLRESSFEDLKQLYTRKLFECVAEKKLPENPIYPSTRPKPDTDEKASDIQQNQSVPPYPVLPAIELQDVRIPDNNLSKCFTELVQLCKDYPENIHASFYAPVKAKDITSFEKRNGLSLPLQLKELLLFSNGFSVDYNDFFSLEQIEYGLKNWGTLTDEYGSEYIPVASVVGDGEYIVFSKETGTIYWEDHGDFTEYGNIDEVLEERMEFIKDDLGVE